MHIYEVTGLLSLNIPMSPCTLRSDFSTVHHHAVRPCLRVLRDLHKGSQVVWGGKNTPGVNCKNCLTCNPQHPDPSFVIHGETYSTLSLLLVWALNDPTRPVFNTFKFFISDDYPGPIYRFCMFLPNRTVSYSKIEDSYKAVYINEVGNYKSIVRWQSALT